MCLWGVRDSPRRVFLLKNTMEKLLKPYDFQIRDSSMFYDTERYEDEFDYLWENKDVPILNMMVGFPKCGKSTYVKEKGLIGFLATAGLSESSAKKYLELDDRTINIVSEMPSWRRLRRMIRNGESVIWDSDNLSRRERERILKKFPDSYRKVAIIWELSDDELRNRGCSQEQLDEGKKNYDRPDGSERIDELVYILS